MKLPKLKSPKIDAFAICIGIFAIIGASQICRLILGCDPFVSSVLLLSAIIGVWLSHVIRKEVRICRAIREEYDKLNEADFKFTRFCALVFSQKAQYTVITRPSSFLVAHTHGEYYFVPVKVFPFGDDPEYARLCAVELCDKLNEKL